MLVRAAVLLFSCSVFALPGCAGGDGAGSSDADFTGAAANRAGLRAEVRVVPVQRTQDQCTLDTDRVEVILANSEAAHAINRALTRDYAGYFTAGCANHRLDL